MDGQLDVKSQLGVGTTFTIKLKSKVYDKAAEKVKVRWCLFANNFRLYIQRGILG